MFCFHFMIDVNFNLQWCFHTFERRHLLSYFSITMFSSILPSGAITIYSTTFFFHRQGSKNTCRKTNENDLDNIGLSGSSSNQHRHHHHFHHQQHNCSLTLYVYQNNVHVPIRSVATKSARMSNMFKENCLFLTWLQRTQEHICTFNTVLNLVSIKHFTARATVYGRLMFWPVDPKLIIVEDI